MSLAKRAEYRITDMRKLSYFSDEIMELVTKSMLF